MDSIGNVLQQGICILTKNIWDLYEFIGNKDVQVKATLGAQTNVFVCRKEKLNLDIRASPVQRWINLHSKNWPFWREPYHVHVKSSKSKPSFTLFKAWTSSSLLFTGHNTIQIRDFRDLTMSIKRMSGELSVHKMYHDGVHDGHNELHIYIYIYCFLFYIPHHKVLHLVYTCFIKSYKTLYIQCCTVFYEHGKTKYGMPCWFCFWESVIYWCHILLCSQHCNLSLVYSWR
jgi:hypothetical protein